MIDGGDGTYIAVVPAIWAPSHSNSELVVGFFDGDEEFFPAFDGAGLLATDWHQNGGETLRTVSFGPVACMEGSHTVPDLETGAFCVCADGFEPDDEIVSSNISTPLNCHKVCPHAGDQATSLGCSCQTEWYNATAAGALVCVPHGGFRAEVVAKLPFNSGDCRPCPLECTDCGPDDIPAISSGWRLNTSTEQLVTQLEKAGGSSPRMQLVFRCPDFIVTKDKASLNSTACPQLPLPTGRRWHVNEVDIACINDHTGTLCGACAAGYWLHGRNCISCKVGDRVRRSFGLSPTGLAVLVVVVVMALFGLARALHGHLAALKMEVFTNAKIILGLAQVVSLLSSVLDLVFPPEPERALNYLALAAIDVHGILQLDCWSRLDWYGRWCVEVAIIPIGLLTLVGAHWMWQRRRGGAEGQAIARQNALSSGFFVVMMMYPRISSTIFTMLSCRWLGPKPNTGPAVLEADYSIDCMSVRHQTYQVVATVLVLLVPIGVPLFALAVLLRASRAHRAEALTAGGGTEPLRESLVLPARTSAEVTVERGPSTEEYEELYIHARLAQQYSFLVWDYRLGCYWYEPCDLLRKLALTSLLRFVERGTAMQVLCGTALAVGSFGLQLRLAPYRQPESNILKAAVDFQIFLTFLLSFVLRSLDGTPESSTTAGLAAYEPNFTQQAYFPGGPSAFYGWVLVGSLLAVLVLAFVLIACQLLHRRRWLASTTTSAQMQFTPNTGDHDRMELVDYRRSHQFSSHASGTELSDSGLMAT
jgi:hypothetical protein